jgi:hypothetical protein
MMQQPGPDTTDPDPTEPNVSDEDGEGDGRRLMRQEDGPG